MEKFLKKEDLENFKKCGSLTIGDLRKWLDNNNDLPEDSLIMIQRVEDKYYEGLDVSGLRSSNGILPEGSKSEGWGQYQKEQSYSGITNYHPAWCCLRYKDEKNLMFIDLHY